MIFCGGVRVDDLNLFRGYVLFVFVLCLMPNVACVSCPMLPVSHAQCCLCLMPNVACVSFPMLPVSHAQCCLCLMPNVACVSGLVFFLVVFVTKHLDFRQLRKVKVESSPIIIITCFNLPSQHNSSTKAISLVSS
jgi:hypothetical protein